MQLPLVSGESTNRIKSPPMDPHRVIAEVAAFYGLSVNHMNIRSRRKRLSYPRQIAYYILMYESRADLSGYKISQMFGRSSPAVYHGARKIAGRMTHDAKLRAEILEICQKITGPLVEGPKMSACHHPDGECGCYVAGYVAGLQKARLEADLAASIQHGEHCGCQTCLDSRLAT